MLDEQLDALANHLVDMPDVFAEEAQTAGAVFDAARDGLDGPDSLADDDAPAPAPIPAADSLPDPAGDRGDGDPGQPVTGPAPVDPDAGAEPEWWLKQ